MNRPRARQSGMTLIEILVAMSVLAVLSVLGYKAFSALLISRERLMETSSQWVELARLFRRVEYDLDRLPVSGTGASQNAFLRLDAAAGVQRLTLSVYSAASERERDRIVYQPGTDGLSWSSARAEARVYPLLGPDYRVRWRILLDDGRWVSAWPDREGDTGVPRALELQVAQQGIGAVTRLWSLP